MSILNSIKDSVRGLQAYALSPHRASVKLNQNESPWDAPPRIKQETLKRVSDRSWSRYPDFVPKSLHERLAEFSGWKAEGIIAGNGSNEMIQAVLMVTVGEGKRVLISEPTFALYRQIATVLGAGVLSVPLTPELTYDVDALMVMVKSAKPAVTIICSPNNPTGCEMEQDDLASLLEVSEGLVVVDEAYFEFSEHTAISLLQQHSNLIVLRTFSKAMAMAALRVGYLLTAPELAREVSKAVLPYNLNAITQTAAEVAIEMYESQLKPLIRSIRAERDRLSAELKQIPGLSPLPSRANFFLVRSQIEPRRIFKELLERDILVRDVSRYPMLEDCFRVSVGTVEENNLLLGALREIYVCSTR